MFNSQCSILIGTEGGRTSPSGCEFNESFFELVRQGDLILHRANDSPSDIYFLMAAPYRACIRGRSSSAENCALGIEHWSDPQLMPRSGFCQGIFARALITERTASNLFLRET